MSTLLPTLKNTGTDLKHITRNIQFILITIMQEKYIFKVNLDAKQYIIIHLDWNYNKCKLIYSMKGYVKQALREFKHILSTYHQTEPSCVNRMQ